MGCDITYIDKHIVETMKQHAPQDWIRFQDLYLRKMAFLPQFVASTRPHEEDQAYYTHVYEPCNDPDMDPDTRILDLFRRAKTVKEVGEIAANHYGLRCGDCMEGAERFYGRHVKELVDAAGRY